MTAWIAARDLGGDLVGEKVAGLARGFHAITNYRTRILFYFGKLYLTPDLNSH